MHLFMRSFYEIKIVGDVNLCVYVEPCMGALIRDQLATVTERLFSVSV